MSASASVRSTRFLCTTLRAAPAAAAACLALGALTPAAATTPTPSATRPAAPTAARIEATLRDVVDLQLLQPTCGERDTLTAAAVDALRTIGVEAKVSGVPKIDLGPLGWIGVGTQYPGKAVALELHLLPTGPAPVHLTLGEKACPVRPAARTPAPTNRAASPAPVPQSSFTPAPPTTHVQTTPATPPQPELARTGAEGTPATWPVLAGGIGLLAAGAATAVAARRRRTTAG